MKTFLEYQLHRVKDYEPKRLHNLFQALQKGGLVAVDLTNEPNDPHIWVQAHPKPEEYDGIRVYLLGNICAFRVQKMKNTQPYGKSYSLDLQQMFDDILDDMGEEASDDMNKAVEKLIEEVGDRIRKFYIDSIRDEEDFIQNQLDGVDRDDVGGAALVPNSGVDYSSTVYSTKN
jgi:hypothetical protein